MQVRLECVIGVGGDRRCSRLKVLGESGKSRVRSSFDSVDLAVGLAWPFSLAPLPLLPSLGRYFSSLAVLASIRAAHGKNVLDQKQQQTETESSDFQKVANASQCFPNLFKAATIYIMPEG